MTSKPNPITKPENASTRAAVGKSKKRSASRTATPTAPTAHDGATVGISLADLTERYLKHLETIGKSRGTVFSYSLDLNVAARHFGKDRDATTLTKSEIAAYFESDAVQKNRGGESKSAITIAKLQRTLRLALVWAAEAGLIADALIPPKAAAAAAENDAPLAATDA